MKAPDAFDELKAAVVLEAGPKKVVAVGGRWVRGGTLRDPGRHPFRIPLHELKLGDTLVSGEREVTVEDIERFAALSGDNFYAHMSETEAARKLLFRNQEVQAPARHVDLDQIVDRIQALVAQGRRFVKPLRYDARSVSAFAKDFELTMNSVVAASPSLRVRAYESFQRQIIDAQLRPGQFVSQRELVQLLGMPLGATMSAPACTWLTHCLARFGKVASLSTSSLPPRSCRIPQCP